jgi:type IV pilus assembly protein PilA
MHKFLNTKLNTFSKKEEGFTIVELLVVIAIIAVLTAIALPFFFDNTAKAAKAAIQSDVKNSVTSLLAYTALNPASTVEELTQQVVSSEGNTVTVGGSSTADFTICVSNPNTPEYTYGYNNTTGQYSEGCSNDNGNAPQSPYIQTDYMEAWYNNPISYVDCGNWTYSLPTGTLTINSGDGSGIKEGAGATLTYTITGYILDETYISENDCRFNVQVESSNNNTLAVSWQDNDAGDPVLRLDLVGIEGAYIAGDFNQIYLPSSPANNTLELALVSTSSNEVVGDTILFGFANPQ